jgi:hypothetical protein
VEIPSTTPASIFTLRGIPKDVAVSYYYFERGKSWSGYYSGPWEHWLKMFVEGKVQRGDWFNHVLSWWNHRHAENILFLTYEDLLNNFGAELRRIGQFLNYPLTFDATSKIAHKTSFKEMKKDAFSNMHEIKEFKGFFRKGEIGAWKDQFTVSQNETFDKLYAERTKNSGLAFEVE